MFQYFGSHPAPGRPLGHVNAWTGVPTGSQSTVLFAYAFRHSGILVTEEDGVVAVILARLKIARGRRSWCRGQHNQFASEAGHSGTGATFSRAAPQRPWQCRLGTRVSLATGRCEWRAASASKSAGLRRDVSDVPVATHRKVKQRGGKTRVSGLLLRGRCAAGHKNPPTSTPCFLSGVFSFLDFFVIIFRFFQRQMQHQYFEFHYFFFVIFLFLFFCYCF